MKTRTECQNPFGSVYLVPSYLEKGLGKEKVKDVKENILKNTRTREKTSMMWELLKMFLHCRLLKRRCCKNASRVNSYRSTQVGENQNSFAELIKRVFFIRWKQKTKLFFPMWGSISLLISWDAIVKDALKNLFIIH